MLHNVIINLVKVYNVSTVNAPSNRITLNTSPDTHVTMVTRSIKLQEPRSCNIMSSHFSHV